MSLPPVPDEFWWTDEAWGAALRCRPLGEVAPHLFTTRQLALSCEADWELVAGALGARRTATLTQVHGRTVVAVRRGAVNGAGSPRADVLVSDDPSVAVAVRAADCVPLLMADSVTGAVAAVHAGWRGTAAAAAAAAVDALAAEFGARAPNLIAAIGPSIGPCCYEVGPDVVDAFAAAGHGRAAIDRWFAAPPALRAGPPLTPGERSPRDAKLRLDTWTANRDQLVLAGVEARNIHAAGLCTACHLALFPSYRVERTAAGRIAGAIRAA